MTGVSSSFRPTAPGSGEKAALGEVSLEAVEFTQEDWEPVVEVVQPTGNAGAVTPSKFSEKSVASWPIRKEKETVPKFWEPSCNWNVGEMFVLQAPVAVKENDLETVETAAVSVA